MLIFTYSVLSDDHPPAQTSHPTTALSQPGSLSRLLCMLFWPTENHQIGKIIERGKNMYLEIIRTRGQELIAYVQRHGSIDSPEVSLACPDAP
jgi:hypothetical protein